MGNMSRRIARVIARTRIEDPRGLPPPKLTPKQQAQIAAQFAESERREKERILEFGDVNPIISATHKGKRIVAVGGTIYWQDEAKWKTFPDFLLAQMWSALGTDWGKSEMSKPEEERHQIVKWKKANYDFTRTVKADADGTYRANLDGPSFAYFALAYDLYVVRHNAELQRRLVERLKHPDQFQGARYELTVTAAFIRGAFDIEFETETDGSIRHNEFIATHRATGQRLVLEAKSRQRRGVFGFRGGFLEDPATMKVGVRGLVEDALGKPAPHPRVVFIDINFPSYRLAPGPVDTAIQEFKETVLGLEREGEPSRWNVIMFTNFPYGYVSTVADSPTE
jgi:hypothetical protein